MKTNRLSPATAGEESNSKIANVDCLRDTAMVRASCLSDNSEYTLTYHSCAGLSRVTEQTG